MAEHTDTIRNLQCFNHERISVRATAYTICRCIRRYHQQYVNAATIPACASGISSQQLTTPMNRIHATSIFIPIYTTIPAQPPVSHTDTTDNARMSRIIRRFMHRCMHRLPIHDTHTTYGNNGILLHTDTIYRVQIQMTHIAQTHSRSFQHTHKNIQAL
jgi:hypothetical protein